MLLDMYATMVFLEVPWYSTFVLPSDLLQYGNSNTMKDCVNTMVAYINMVIIQHYTHKKYGSTVVFGHAPWYSLKYQNTM